MTEGTASDTIAGSAGTPAAGDERACDERACDERAWTAAAAGVLRKAGRLAADAPDSAAWDRLARSTVEGLRVPPLGTPGRAAGLPTHAAMAADPGVAPYLRGAAAPAGVAGGWDVRSLIADPDPAAANRAALADLAGGATSLWIRIGDGGTEPGDLAAVLGGVHLDMAPVVLDAPFPADTDAAYRALSDVVSSVGPLHPDSNLGADPLGALARRSLSGHGVGRHTPLPADHRQQPLVQQVVEIATVATDLGIGAFVVDGTILHEAGAGDAAEVGYTLAVGAEYLRALAASGHSVDSACRLIGFRYAATDDQFATIGKLRAARLAWHRVTELSGAAPEFRAQRQHAVTSAAMLTRHDPWVNLLRATVAAFAAGVGGAAAVTVLPFDSALGIPDEFGRRMARNIPALLLGESHVGAVADPAGGAHAVEMLTAALAEAAWAEFERIESAGGILAALVDDSLARRVVATRVERDRRIATRRQPITGVSEFPNPTEDLPVRRPHQGSPEVRRWAQPFEVLRDEPPDQPVMLLAVGTPAAAATRLQFMRNLLAAGGISVSEPDSGSDGAAAVTRSGCRTIVLAGADGDYDSGLAAAATAARQAGATAIFVAGRPAGVLAGLPDGLVDAAVAAGDDVLDFLTAVRASLGGDRP